MTLLIKNREVKAHYELVNCQINLTKQEEEHNTEYEKDQNEEADLQILEEANISTGEIADCKVYPTLHHFQIPIYNWQCTNNMLLELINNRYGKEGDFII